MIVLKKKMTLMDFVFPKLRTAKTWLDKCLKSFVAENISTSNMLNGSKHCSNLHHSTFIIFIYQCQGSWVGASLSYWHAKSWDFLLTYSLPITSMLFLIVIISRYQFRCNNLRNKKLFPDSFINVWDLY